MIGGLAACGNAESATSADVQTDATAGTDATAEDVDAASTDVAIDVASDAADASDSVDSGDGTPTECQPYCGAIGTKSEAWFGGCTHAALTDPATGFPMWDLCAKCVAVCKLDGSKSEGWYSSCTDKLIQWNNCM